jgi:hypothetical protein
MRYRLSADFKAAVARSGIARYRLATRGNLSPARFSALWNDVSFGPITHQRVIAIGSMLGLIPDACADAVDYDLTVAFREQQR